MCGNFPRREPRNKIMENTKLTITQAIEAINSLPKAQRESSAVQGWLSSAVSWSSKSAPGLKVAIEFDGCPSWGQTFLLSIVASHPSRRGLAACFLRLSIPAKSRYCRRTSLKRTDFIDTKKVPDAMWRVKYNMTESAGGIH